MWIWFWEIFPKSAGYGPPGLNFERFATFAECLSRKGNWEVKDYVSGSPDRNNFSKAQLSFPSLICNDCCPEFPLKK